MAQLDGEAPSLRLFTSERSTEEEEKTSKLTSLSKSRVKEQSQKGIYFKSTHRHGSRFSLKRKVRQKSSPFHEKNNIIKFSCGIVNKVFFERIDLEDVPRYRKISELFGGSFQKPSSRRVFFYIYGTF